MHSVIIQAVDPWVALSGEWEAISDGHPFHLAPWGIVWWKHYGSVLQSGNRLFVNCVRSDRGDLRAVAPFYLDAGRLRTRLRFIGSGHVCTDYQEIVGRECGIEEYELIADQIDRLLREQSLLAACQIEMEGVDPQAEWYRLFCRIMQQRGYSWREEAIESSYITSLPETWDDYLATHSKGSRRRPKRHVARIDSGEYEFYRVSGVQGLQEMLPRLCDLHQRRRQMLGQPGSFADGRFLPFLMDLAEYYGPSGRMEIQWCQQGGSVPCMQLVFLHAQTISLYCSGVDPDYLDMEPGHFMISVSFRDAIARGIRHFDFLRGDEPYKTLWHGKPRAMVRAFLTPARRVSLAVEGVSVVANVLKQQFKQALGSNAQT